MNSKFNNIISGVLTFFVLLKITQANNAAARNCCPGENLFRHGCIGAPKYDLLKCNHGRFMMNPTVNEDDQYNITENGELDGNFGMTIANSEYCLTNLLANDKNNETNEILFVCFENPEISSALFMLKGSLALVSVIFIAATLYVYWIMEDLRETQDKVTSIALICLMTFLIFLAIIQIIMPDKLGAMCPFFGFIVYFFTIAYFTWLNIIMLNVWKVSVFPRWKIYERTWYILNHIYGWSIPILMLTLVFTLDPMGFSVTQCWFENRSDTWLFVYIPISILLLLNVILFSWSAYGIHSAGADISPDRKKSLTYKFRLYLKLFILAGATWILEVLSFQFTQTTGLSYWLLADVLNGLHGVLIFLVLILWRHRIRKELAGKRILCFRAPKSWADPRNNEEDQLHEEEQPVEQTRYDLIVTK